MLMRKSKDSKPYNRLLANNELVWEAKATGQPPKPKLLPEKKPEWESPDTLKPGAQMNRKRLLGLIVETTLIMLLLAGCATGTATSAPETPTATPTPEPPTATALPPTGHPSENLYLTETHVIADFGFSIDYPAGWFAGTRDTVTTISQLERDHEHNFGGRLPPLGYQVILDHRDMDFMRDLGLPSDPSLEDLLELNIDYFNLLDPEVSETEIFGEPALCATVRTKNKCGGFIGDETFLVSVKAPTKAKFDQVLAIWEEMRRSIEPVPDVE